MNALDMARTAYSSAAAPVRTQQSTEYEVFAQITSRIRSAQAKGQPAFAELVAALHDNRRLWTLLAADVADAGNALPEALRAQIMYLADYTLHHTPLILKKTASAEILIEINTAIMRGLRQQESRL